MKDILFISPVKPDVNGFGREKRAHQWITVLSRQYTVTVILVSQASVNKFEKKSFNAYSIQVHLSKYEKIIELFCYLISLFTVQLKGISNLYWTPLKSAHKKNLYEHFQGRKFDKIICFRLYLTEYASYLQSITNTQLMELDMDDVESSTWFKISNFLWINRKIKKVCIHRLTSLQFRINERKSIQLYDRIYICSELDRQLLSNRFSCNKFYVFTNKIFGKNKTVTKKNPGLSLLFVGILSYYPNEEAIRWFINQVFPSLKVAIPGIKINIVGRHASPSLKAFFSDQKEIVHHENAGSIGHIYNSSAIAISPLHAGGGTKLKIIEAMWYGVPVVATKESVRGMDLDHGIHYLEANEPAEFITCCKSLIQNPSLYNRLTLAADKLVTDFYNYH